MVAETSFLLVPLKLTKLSASLAEEGCLFVLIPFHIHTQGSDIQQFPG